MKSRSIRVARSDLTLARIVREALDTLPWNKARELCRQGKVTVDGERVFDGETRVAKGREVVITPEAQKVRRGVLAPEAIVHVDAQVVVVNKPAGMLSVPFSEEDRDTLIDITRAALRRRGPRGYSPELGIVHRIDIDTTGLLVFTRTLEAKRALSAQFRRHSVHRRYVALVHGHPRDATHDTLLIRERGDGLKGSWGRFRKPRGNPPEDAQRAITHIRVLEQFEDASLVECALETGRQHQIRIHLSEAGNPLIGERVYIRDFEGEPIVAARPMLHAIELGFVHPGSGEEVRFEMDPPSDFVSLLERLRGPGRG